MKEAENTLKSFSLRVTPTRVLLMQMFQSSQEALSSQDIEARFPDADRITLYRTLKTFEDKGIIHQAIDGTSKSKYALCVDDCSEDHHHDSHAHFHCEKCGKTVCVEDITVPSINTPSHLKVKQASIILQGECESCH